MDGQTAKEIKHTLLERWQQLSKSSQQREISQDNNVATPQVEIIDIAQSLEQMGRDTSIAEQERREMMAVERALAKMATGNYGICEECGEEIPAKRLNVLPEARLCAACQAFEERQGQRVRQLGAVSR